MSYRIVKRPKGWVVEAKKTVGVWPFRWYQWRFCITVSGIESLPWHFETFYAAKKSLLDLVETKTFNNSIYHSDQNADEIRKEFGVNK